MFRILYVLCILVYTKPSSAFPILDIGFGTSLMFVDETNRKEILDKEKTILPTTSSLVFWTDILWRFFYSFIFKYTDN